MSQRQTRHDFGPQRMNRKQRRAVVAARALIGERGYGSTPAEIRRCRQDLLDTPLRSIARFGDFFSTSECREMLFHVQEGG